MIRTINIILIVICIILGYTLYKNINKPIKAQEQIQQREEVVHSKLIKIRDSQEAYRTVHGKFAPTFEDLKDALKNESYAVVSRNSGDTLHVAIKDSLFAGNTTEINELNLVPFSDNKSFELFAGVLPSPSDSTLYIPVFEAKTYTDIFLGGENGIDPDYWVAGEGVKVGSKTSPIMTGNWE